MYEGCPEHVLQPQPGIGTRASHIARLVLVWLYKQHMHKLMAATISVDFWHSAAGGSAAGRIVRRNSVHCLLGASAVVQALLQQRLSTAFFRI